MIYFKHWSCSGKPPKLLGTAKQHCITSSAATVSAVHISAPQAARKHMLRKITAKMHKDEKCKAEEICTPFPILVCHIFIGDLLFYVL